MAIQIQGNGGTAAEVDGTGFRALRATIRPTDPGTLGHYRVSAVTGTLAAALAAGAQVFQFKWTDATRFAVINTLRYRFQTLTAFTAATVTDFGFDAVLARSYAAGGGGTALTLTGNNGKMRTSMGTTIVGGINVATTGALTAATTLDSNPFNQSVGKPNVTNAAAGTEYGNIGNPAEGLFAPNVDKGEHPLVLAVNEGIVIKNRVVWPAAGTGILVVEIAWTEVTAY